MDSVVGVENLSNRQKEILHLIAQHYQMKEIARMLKVSVSTVRTHTEEARRRLGVASSRDAALMLLRHEGLPAVRKDEESEPVLVQADPQTVVIPLRQAPGPLSHFSGHLSRLTVAQCAGLVILLAVGLALALMILLAASATMVQAIQNLTQFIF